MRETEENSFFRLEPEINDDDYMGNDVTLSSFTLAAITMLVATLFIFAITR